MHFFKFFKLTLILKLKKTKKNNYLYFWRLKNNYFLSYSIAVKYFISNMLQVEPTYGVWHYKIDLTKLYNLTKPNLTYPSLT